MGFFNKLKGKAQDAAKAASDMASEAGGLDKLKGKVRDAKDGMNGVVDAMTSKDSKKDDTH